MNNTPPEEAAPSLEASARLSHEDVAWAIRFAPVGHPYFKTGTPLCLAFYDRFKMLGNMTPQVSKKIGL